MTRGGTKMGVSSAVTTAAAAAAVVAAGLLGLTMAASAAGSKDRAAASATVQSDGELDKDLLAACVGREVYSESSFIAGVDPGPRARRTAPESTPTVTLLARFGEEAEIVEITVLSEDSHGPV